jgi:mitofusin
MSQDYFSGAKSSSLAEDSLSDPSNDSPTSRNSHPMPVRPHFMTVGSGSLSSNAARLTALLDDDSGYGGSVIEDNASVQQNTWNPGLTEDRPTPSHTPTLRGETNAAGM